MTKEQLEATINEMADIMHITGNSIDEKCNVMLVVFRQVGQMLPELKKNFETMMKSE